MNYASKAYPRTAIEVAKPGELKANLLVKAAATLHAARESWPDEPKRLDDALTYNRRLWTVLLDSLIKDDGGLPAPLHKSLKTLGAFVRETVSLMTKPKQRFLNNLININSRIAFGLRGRL